jgi:replicative DNA helicase
MEKGCSEITAVDADKSEIVPIKSSLTAMIERIESRFETNNAMTGAPTGIIDLDAITNGLQRTDLIIMAARPSQGKTACMMRIVESVALQESRPNVLVFSIEMPESALSERMTASIGRIELNKIRTGKFEEWDWPKLTTATMLLSTANIHYYDASSITVANMRTVIKRVEREHGKLALVAVDYLQLIDDKAENETLKIGKISGGLKKIAKDFDVPVLALSQLNRGVEARAEKRPTMADLRQSGALEQDADLIMMLYRDEVYHKDSHDKGVMEIIITKHRQGEIGTVKASYLGEYTRVENLQHSHSEDYQ